jgi:hypothetical protein
MLAGFLVAAGMVAGITALARAGIMFSLEAGLGAQLVALFSSFMNVGAPPAATGIAMAVLGVTGFSGDRGVRVGK